MNTKATMSEVDSAMEGTMDIPYSYEIVSILPQTGTALHTPEHMDMLLVLSGRPEMVEGTSVDKNARRMKLPIGQPIYVKRPYSLYAPAGQARVLRVSFPKGHS